MLKSKALYSVMSTGETVVWEGVFTAISCTSLPGIISIQTLLAKDHFVLE